MSPRYLQPDNSSFHLVFPDVAEVPRQYFFGTFCILINNFFYDFLMLFKHLSYLFPVQINGWRNLEEIIRNDARHLYEQVVAGCLKEMFMGCAVYLRAHGGCIDVII